MLTTFLLQLSHEFIFLVQYSFITKLIYIQYRLNPTYQKADPNRTWGLLSGSPKADPERTLT